jgi:hypothetical protein
MRTTTSAHRTGIRRIVLILATMFALVPLGAGTGAAAPDDVTPQATNFNGDCESGEFCLFIHDNQDSYAIDYGAAGSRTCDQTYSNNNFPGTNINVNDEVSSWWNRLSGITVRVYAGLYYSGASQDLPPGSRGNFEDTRVGEDEASSHRSIGSGC